ncbi:MAG: hypothetical protein H7A45_00735 [Verrucomicrobiales bacterium]|nr:hypothetical protein [Verrucomicrobiales bacterium]MCP5525210.1 hypothetical protein [Verrucomicrobiales bacterium]
MQNLSWRERVSDRLPDWPVLRTLVLNPLFGLTLLAVAMVLVGVLISLPKIWRATPEGFRPIVRISLLDLAQAWSLRRAAEREQQAGDFEQELQARFGASKNNLGRLDLVREALQAYLRVAPFQERFKRDAARSAAWLLQLSATNASDAYLVARTYDTAGYTAEVLGLLEPRKDELPAELQGPFAKALFDSGQPERFGEWWMKAGGRLELDPELRLYHAAWQLGWGEVGQREAALATLRAAAEDLDHRLLANRLMLAVYLQRADVEHYRETLDRLVAFRGDRLVDHVRYWLMLQSAGRREEGRRLALGYASPPGTPMEVTLLAQALVQLGSDAEARALLERYGDTLGNAGAVFTLPYWALLGDLLIKAKDWEALRRLGERLQALPGAWGSLRGFGQFIEGRAWHEMGVSEAARERLLEMVGTGLNSPEMSIEVGILLLRMGYPDIARQVLVPLETRFADSFRYWQALFEAAYAERRDEALVFKAARRALDLQPDDPVRQLNYAYALLVNRIRPEEAARLTFACLEATPRSALIRLNHASALAQTGRVDEAARILAGLSGAESLGAQTSIAMVELEIASVRNDAAGMAAALKKIDPEELFPKQRAWFREVQARAAP